MAKAPRRPGSSKSGKPSGSGVPHEELVEDWEERLGGARYRGPKMWVVIVGSCVALALIAYFILRYGGFGGAGSGEEGIAEGKTNRWRVAAGLKQGAVIHIVYPNADEVFERAEELRKALRTRNFCLMNLLINNAGGTTPVAYTVDPPMVRVVLKDGRSVSASNVREAFQEAGLNPRRYDATEVVPGQSEMLFVLFEQFFTSSQIKAVYWGERTRERMRRE